MSNFNIYELKQHFKVSKILNTLEKYFNFFFPKPYFSGTKKTFQNNFFSQNPIFHDQKIFVRKQKKNCKKHSSKKSQKKCIQKTQTIGGSAGNNLHEFEGEKK